MNFVLITKLAPQIDGPEEHVLWKLTSPVRVGKDMFRRISNRLRHLKGHRGMENSTAVKISPTFTEGKLKVQ